ncbi:UDP-glucose 6-dehydrogenase [bacterium (Candidatus Blackallbacteria) CG17_big_fil_post_rev_8_21_14_2_50_48_46]|uniref:UDP-glucose 6-dehydrogenase n=1 Tax=bacterium (Candidatus Blackallbacteria) CG17_big_fil_post_rev_8_21_14_2_50_48_46 TaxID=2014261 RepID=A0A2M7G1M8_9BACT|nr:MAG: UDP-glucose 6-dehydrogenase [bacterium (Candidatus Blackallbacteria) CG18_big_fil_WC_8_21_14_2_50_49_26]PIW15437.1 MAG: UDP-glucose 6-dehydrogenase [bacterium (Candidatus Blackallbacteria) CG17_big_fil_post_rev_8_21_14_2_50_48_46]PIW49702.1 MAG: UDP-glucose 6-dehydrogenase [bacterium (Candidatus Blackallbacteria) CG13_big_fil_rev_8_21_14_2_50_49_14]
MKIAIIGSGYVGLVTGTCLAELGHEVLCIDNHLAKIQALQAGQVPIYEPGLEELLQANVAEGRLKFSSEIADGVHFADILFICVGTPSLPDGSVDLSVMERVIKEIAGNMQSYKLIVEKSTVPVRTAESMEALARKHLVQRSLEFDLASNPEFLAEGSALQDFMQPDRVVLGVNSERAASLLVQLYAPLNAPMLITDINSAELIKHASNAFLAMKISFTNALATICERTGADISKVTRGMGLDKRIGSQFLRAGIGFGGSCFPKDLSGFIHIVEEHGYDFSLLKAVQEINLRQRQHFIEKVKNALGNLNGKEIALMGLSFKPHTDDIREAPSLYIIEALLAQGAQIRAYDPVAMPHVKERLGAQIHYAADAYQACEGADAALFITEWPEFRYLNLPQLKTLMKQAIIIDGRNIFDPGKLQAQGFYYDSIGRAPVQAP